MRRAERLGISFGTVIATLALSAMQVLALTCYWPNEGAWAGDPATSSSYHYGWKGETDLHLASPHAGAGIYHPTQIGSPIGEDFVGWGLYKGVGATGCPDNWTSSWRIYIDGWANNSYFCKATYGTVPDGAQNQYFRIEYTTCPGDNHPKWVFYWNGVWKTCKTINSGHGWVSAGSESLGTYDTQNLRVDYLALRAKDGLGNWIVLPQVVDCEDAPYAVDLHWNAAWDIVQ